MVRVLKRLLAAGVPGVVLEAPRDDALLEVDLAALRDLRAPVIGVVAPQVLRAGDEPATIAAAGEPARAAALAAIRGTVPVLAAARARHLVVTCGAAGLAGEAETRFKLAHAGSDRASVLATHRAATRREREHHGLAICRVLFGLARELSPVHIHVMPDSDPLGYLDPQSVEWILDDLAAQGVTLALDAGFASAVEASGGAGPGMWAERHGPRLGFLFISNHDPTGSGEIPPSLDCGNLANLRDVISRRLPRAVRPAPNATVEHVLASVDEAVKHLGAVGDVNGW